MSHIPNVRNSRTTFPKLRARRQGAYDRFKFSEERAAKDSAYAKAKAAELSALKSHLGIA